MQPTGVFVGAATLDLHFLVAATRTRNSKGPAEQFGMYAGGPAANAAVTFAHLGGSAHLITEIGAHLLGTAITRDLTGHAVQVHDLVPDDAAAPMVSSIVSYRDGDRLAVSSHYADTGRWTGEFEGLPPGAGILLVDGFLRTVCLDALHAAGELGIPVVLDGGSWKDGMDELLPLVDVAVCSADFRPPGTSDSLDALDYLQDHGVDRVAVTRGAETIRFRVGSHRGAIEVPQVDVVDTLGAGDVFHGALCHSLARDREFEDALADAAAVATRSCTSFGTRSWMEGKR